MNSLAVAVGGFIGAILRYSIGLILSETLFPFETLTVNIVGCFLLGWFLSSTWVTKHVPKVYHLAIGTGLIGSFTTYSTFSIDTVNVSKEMPSLAILYVFLSIGLGLWFAMLGMGLGKRGLKKG